MSARRIPGAGLVDQSQTLSFTFDGKPYRGHPGDTLASALLASGLRIMGRSFKYHRPRGPFGAWFDDPNAVFDVSLNGQAFPNLPATTTPLEDGMQARAVNAWPSAGFDIRRGLDLFHRFLGAGFYYKTFMWPSWHLFEPMIRRMAGMGRLAGAAPEGFVADQIHDACEVLVVGGGAAGLAAARTAAEAGRDVVLVDDHPEPGGGLFAMGVVDGQDAAGWIAAQVAAIKGAGGRVLCNTTAFGAYDHQMVGLATERGFAKAPRLRRMRAGRIILASGAIDRPITFARNDLPGIMSLWAAGEYLGRYGVLVGREITVLSNNNLAEATAARLEAVGASVRLLDASKGSARAIGSKGFRALVHAGQRYRGDTLLVSGGLTPLVHLWRHAGGKLDWDAGKAAFVPGKPPKGMVAAGAVNGAFDLEQAIEEGRAAGAGQAPRPAPGRYHLAPLWPKPGGKGRQWIDFQHDVTLKDIEIAARENFVSVEHLKRFTTLGMAADQGKTSNMAGLAAMAALQDKPIPEVGTTTFRPPFVPVSLSLYHAKTATGQLYHPLKRLPLERRHRAAGAALGEYGGWLRPGWYGAGPAEQAVAREVTMAREAAGIFDASPLGKVEVMGPDAEAFVNFVYYNSIATLKPGAIRYGFLLSEQGAIFDDGVVARLGAERFVISCSSSHVDGVVALLESWRQDGNDPDRIFLHDTTQNWPTVTITGPRAREIVATLELGIDLAPEAFPHMTLREGMFQGAPARVARVSFTGEVSYEISTTVANIAALWDAVIAAGKPLGAGPLGIEAMSVMRAEKGYIIIGKDTIGDTMPHDLGFTMPRLKKRAAFVGDRGLHSAAANDPLRKQLVGLRVPKGAPPLETGAHLVERQGGKPRSIGFVTSSYMSPTLGHPIALALLEGGAARMGERIEAWHLGKSREVEACAPCFLDPEGRRLHA